jgi:hypothetical protein
LILNEGKLLLPYKARMEAVLRVDAIHDCLDGDEDFGEHFASNANSPGQTSAGGGAYFRKKLSRAFMAPTTPQNVWRVPMTGVLFEHLFHPADLFSEGFGLALLKFPEVYQLPLDARFS